MKKRSIFFTLILVLLAFTYQLDFLSEQKKFVRVRTLIKEKEKSIISLLKGNYLVLNELNLLFVVYKDVDQLDIYAKSKQDKKFKVLTSYTICSRSGELGPKREYGDMQVPEGFYHINRFNPTSNFYVSLGINYPNNADKIKSTASNLGGDIFIHGSCVTVGCLPMTDDKIKEIYYLAMHAKNNGQKNIPVYIFPYKMTDENQKTYKIKFKHNETLLSFWSNLKVGFDKFCLENKELLFTVDNKGNYKF